MLVLAGRGLASTHAVVLGIRGLLQREVDAAFAGLLRQVWISDQVEAELLAIVFEAVQLVNRSDRLILLMLLQHRLQLRALRDYLRRDVVPWRAAVLIDLYRSRRR